MPARVPLAAVADALDEAEVAEELALVAAEDAVAAEVAEELAEVASLVALDVVALLDEVLSLAQAARPVRAASETPPRKARRLTWE